MNSLASFENSDFLQENQQPAIQIGQYSYKCSNALGYGSNSGVYRGKNNSTNEDVAIKVIELKRLKTTMQKMLLQNEKKVIRQLIEGKVQGVSKYIQIVASKTHIYMVMEYEDGGDLQSLINQEKIPKELVYKYLLQILNSYIMLYQNKVIHRDLKPANILLNKNGDLKIADFGFAVLQSEETKKYNYCLGSPVYCSPQSLESYQYGLKSDIWAIGVITYKILTGKTPWMAKNNQELIKKMKQISISSLMQGTQDLMLKQFIIGCCTLDISKRFGISEITTWKLSLQKHLRKLSQKIEDQKLFSKCEKYLQNEEMESTIKKVKLIKKQQKKRKVQSMLLKVNNRPSIENTASPTLNKHAVSYTDD